MIIKEIIFLNGACSWKGNGLLFWPYALRSKVLYVYPPEGELYLRRALPVLRSPARRDEEGCDIWRQPCQRLHLLKI